ncbi:HD-GYP domain-containing protein [Metabacillus malikii]|uniref:HD-GYP domain-containing protein (C-di-GMP phosphodiesterase class II) n=1 Tax=Metabacillus malikii TaxID=1504265 RepID=A0ABT9ZPM8_9BACI|nr:HD-GYP domain-containing protein [Metabacillus malikii]MDQ0233195.1 HD-GYP domain-containing protein (c-di-GMP phosphodiesterase class II) [Metabacillus malikii]
MKVQVNRLVEGNVLLNDVVSASNKPLILKNTTITDYTIEVLNAFLIKEVDILEGVNSIGIEKLTNENSSVNLTEEKSVDQVEFVNLYMETVKNYKNLYISWQSGASIDISRVRKIILPLVDRVLLEKRDEVFKLYHYANIEDYLFHHSVSVSLLSTVLAKNLGYKQGDIRQIALTGLLCDSGMAKIDVNYLSKSVTLTEKEYKDVRQHPIQSYQLLKNIMSIKEGVKIGVLQHHERIDGSGYPLGIKGEQLHPFSKIVALADTYQAMVSIRPYRSKQSPFKVLEQIMQDDFGKFDIRIVNELKRLLLTFSSGTKILLSDGSKAEIVFVDEQHPTRPLVKIIDSNNIIALKDNSDLFIEELI